MSDTPQYLSPAFSKNTLLKLVGTPYETLDCWGVTREFYRLHGVNLKQYYLDAPNNTEVSAGLISKYRSDFDKVTEPRYGDIILINLLGLPSHIAVFLEEGLMLHTNKKTGCMIDKLSRWEKQIVAFYRVRLDDKTPIKSV